MGFRRYELVCDLSLILVSFNDALSVIWVSCHCWLDDRGSISYKTGYFSSPRSPVGPSVDPGSYPVVLSSRVKRLEREADHTPPPTGIYGIRMHGAIPPLPDGSA